MVVGQTGISGYEPAPTLHTLMCPLPVKRIETDQFRMGDSLHWSFRLWLLYPEIKNREFAIVGQVESRG